ncbi:putative GNAT family acetyltransferase [Rhizobium sp. BK529]|uniref:GNAT family N-acetyltransferase n=1 Tax=unclassified Rhizobium TaxID=2613769 RepID=UPI001050C23F|nr:MULTISPECIES: GNAT family N-acetyltransferase [unclassified Rhizobium]MBB3590025.1 putative GNAT family acetyltransferase [Rhizobium sp. BK529]TCS04722.1 FR47-like protein [Rhizobium sp. BK418]
MNHVLDRPVWNALQTTHADLAEGGKRAMRYPPSIVPFAAAADDGRESLEALENLPADDEVMAIVEAGPVTIPDGLTVVSEGKLVQMIAERPYERISDSRLQRLTADDAEEMLALATLTKPGPFTLGAQRLGTFWGVKIDGRLVAMAGQRLRHPGFGELSGLCTHPDFQGRGLGTLLFRFVAGEISARGDTVFLHAYYTNTPAITLYEDLGFKLRSEMNLRVVKRRA